MDTLALDQDWLRKLLPEGFPYPSSTLISGPGGTGKPLVEFAFVTSWLRAGGSVIGIPLQYPTAELLRTAMKELYRLNLEDYAGKTAYIQFVPSMEDYEQTETDTIKANLLKPAVWNEVVRKAGEMVEQTALGTLVFGSALNLLLFSPTYHNGVIKNLTEVLQHDRSKTYLFSVSTSALAEDIRLWEEVADNLMYTRMEKPIRLFFQVSRMKDVPFLGEEIEVPISNEILDKIKAIAEKTRTKMIPEIRNI